MTVSPMTKEEIERLLCAERYSSRAEAIAACQALSEPGDEIEIHSEDCTIDTEDECTCEPIVVVHRKELASA